jgi:serine/threonine protein kinase/tetratricopeptide (TPR) repeat protein
MSIECPKCQTDNPSDSKFCKECATPIPLENSQPSFTKTLETPVSELTRGTLFAGRYEIIEELGSGGMGKVYRVEDKKANEEIALKLIRPEVAADKKTIDRFRNELTTARKIRHKNVCGMYDLGEYEGTHYITMEYVSGEDLKSLVRRVTFDTGTAIKIAKQMCEGLVEAHRLGVIHRDLKPSNIMIDKEGNARIMDFGIARSLSAKGLTGDGIIIGTPEYMSPEQAEAKEVDRRSDLYSLGVILYEIVTGRLPFDGDTPLAIAMKHKGETPKEPKAINPQIPEDLNRSILKCLEKEKDNRFQHAEEVLSVLGDITQDMPVTEKEIPKRKPLTSKEITVTFGVKKLLIPALVIAAALIALVFIWQPWAQKDTDQGTLVPTDKPSLAVLYFENNSGKLELENWRSGLCEMLITDLDQSKLLHVISSDRIYTLLEELNLLEKEKFTTDDLIKVASRTGVSHVVRGSFITAGDKFIITAALMKSGKAVVMKTIRKEGMGEESITDSVDEITLEIKAELDLTEEEIAEDFDKNLAEITTSSPEAFKYYSEGIKLRYQVKHRESISSFERAISLDPDFALAYRGLGIAYGSLGLTNQRNEFMEKAMALKERLTDKERYNIEASYYLESEETFDKALDAYLKLTELYPDDMSASHGVGLMYSKLGEIEKAISFYEKAIEGGYKFSPTFQQLASCYREVGEPDKAKEVLEYYLANIQDNAFIHNELTAHYRYLGKYDLALDEVDKALSLEPEHISSINQKANIYKNQGDLTKAENTFWKLMEYAEPAAGYFARNGLSSLDLIKGKYEKAKSWLIDGIEIAREWKVIWVESDWHAFLSYIHVQTGQPEEALLASEKARESAILAKSNRLRRQCKALWRKGLALLAKQAIVEARKTADELKKFIDAGIPNREIFRYYHLMGEIESETEDYSKAVDHFQQALSLNPDHPEYINSLAVAYNKSGDLNKAREQYEKLTALTPGGMWNGDLYSKAFFMLGKIHEQQGDKAKAIEHYQKFLALWNDADPGLPEVDDARTRLSALKTQ